MKDILAGDMIAAVALTGWAVNVQRRSVADAPLQIPTASSRGIVANITGSSVATRWADAEPFMGERRAALAAAAASRGATSSAQERAARGRPARS